MPFLTSRSGFTDQKNFVYIQSTAKTNKQTNTLIDKGGWGGLEGLKKYFMIHCWSETMCSRPSLHNRDLMYIGSFISRVSCKPVT